MVLIALGLHPITLETPEESFPLFMIPANYCMGISLGWFGSLPILEAISVARVMECFAWPGLDRSPFPSEKSQFLTVTYQTLHNISPTLYLSDLISYCCSSISPSHISPLPLAVPSAWKFLLPDSHMTSSLITLRSWLNVTLQWGLASPSYFKL